MLLGLLVETFVGNGPLVIGVDETLERRWGKKIGAKGIYRDQVRASHEHFVKASGLRWVCLMLLVEVPWASRVWGLPFLSVLAPSERYTEERGKKRHKKLTHWARQMLLLVRRWYPEREKFVAVADRGYAAISLDLSIGPLRTLTQEAHHLHHALLAPGRGALRAGPATQTASDVPSASQGSTPANLGSRRRRSEHHLDDHHGSQLVRRSRKPRGAHRRGGLGDGGLVPHGAAAGAHALGADP